MNEKLPDFFRPLFWSYDFSQIDLERHKKTVIVNTVNFGTLRHWHWLKACYGTPAIEQTLQHIATTELRPPAKKLAEVLFHIRLPEHVYRSTTGSQ